jgi:peptide/nickel transport system substrate-binding protein
MRPPSFSISQNRSGATSREPPLLRGTHCFRPICIELERRQTETIVMDRRAFLKTTAGAGALTATCALSTPAISQPAARTLRFVPQADLANFDPIWSATYVVRNASVMVWDTLYGQDDKLVPQRQMVEAEEVSPDGLTWTFRLRPELRFHDGEPVLAKDVVASIHRWTARDPVMGQMIKAIENELTASDDRTFRWVLKKPFPRMRLALGKLAGLCCFVMQHWNLRPTGRFHR